MQISKDANFKNCICKLQIEVCLIIGYAVQALADKEVELGDSAPYFLDCAEKLAQPGFLPSDEDILRYRWPIYSN